MNKSRIRLISIVTAVVMSLTMLSGCTEIIKREAERSARKEIESLEKEGARKAKGKIEKLKKKYKNSKKGKKKGNIKKKASSSKKKKLSSLKYKGHMIVKVNKNVPKFSKSLRKKKAVFTKYSEPDSMGRCRKVTALIGPETLADEERGSIGMYKPTGWHTIRYDVVGKGSAGYLYNRCHLLAFCLNGNSTNNEKNLITGTRQFNAGKESMLTYELETVKYIERTNNHVLYRVTPVFRKGELVARGVHMEGYSIEDKGKGIKFNVFVHNHQDGITIDYRTGESRADNGEKGKGAVGGY